MARNRRSKQKHTTRKKRKTCKTSRDVAGYSTGDTEFSERLSRILDHLAINEHLIQLRRKRMFAFEGEITLTDKAFGLNRRTFIFGSQIEGTTTNDMMSDVDQLQRFDTFRLFLDSENPPFQPNDHQVLIKVNTNGYHSQYCVLKLIELLTQARRFKQMDPNRDPVDIVNFFRTDWATTDGLIPHTIMFDISNTHGGKRKQSQRHGPAEHLWNTDHIYACYCKSLPKQCKFVFERPRPGHWPSEKTLKKAKKYGVFIVPQGPPKSTNICTYDYFDYHWRISTNLTERLFMFSLDTVHLKAYVLTKMIRKELFVSEYQDRLSTFHFKTAFFFAVENTRPDVWREDNLINCVKYILATLRRFLTRRFCPYFTIENVNLFEGKIERQEFQKLVDKLTYVIYSLRTKIENIHMDNIGRTLKEQGARKNEHTICFTNGSALLDYVIYFFLEVGHSFYGDELIKEIPVNCRKAVFETELTRLQTYYRAPFRKYRKYNYALHGFMSNLASFLASVYLEQKADGHECYHDGIKKVRRIYSLSLESDIIGNYMRYASFLFCNGEYDEACKYFELIEKQIEEDKKSNLIYQLIVSPSEILASQIAKQSWEQFFKQQRSVFLMFIHAQAMCVPEFLRCETYRGRFGTFTLSGLRLPVYSNDDCICVQIEPYLYYLQYLTYRLLNQEPQRLKALMKLSIFTEILKPARFTSSNGCMFVSHFDTSLNMLGHCLEMEQQFASALMIYKTSLKMLPQRNAAVLHIIRLLWPVIQTLMTYAQFNYNLKVFKRKHLMLTLCDYSRSEYYT